MYTLVFWKQVLERAVKTAAQTVVAVYVGGDVVLNAFDVDWSETLGISLGAGFLSVMTSLASEPFGPADSPSTVSVAPKEPVG